MGMMTVLTVIYSFAEHGSPSVRDSVRSSVALQDMYTPRSPRASASAFGSEAHSSPLANGHRPASVSADEKLAELRARFGRPSVVVSNPTTNGGGDGERGRIASFSSQGGSSASDAIRNRLNAMNQ